MPGDEFEVQRKYGSDDWIDDLGIPREKRFSRPKLPHPETGVVQPWTRTSTIAKVLDDTYNLELWKQRMVAKGVASRRDLTNRAATTDVTDRSAFAEICELAMEHAGASEGRNNGTSLHSLVETYNRDPQSFDASRYPEALLDDLWAYVDALKAAGITMAPDLAERTTVNVAAGIAGTWDGVAYCRSWAFPRIADLKTQKTIDYSQASISIQVAGYAYGNVMLPKPWPGKDGTAADYLEMPVVDLKKGLLIHVPVGKAECHIYDIDIEAGYSALKTAVSVRRWRTRKDLFSPLPLEHGLTPSDDLSGPAIPRQRKPVTPVGGSIPTARHTKVEKVIEHASPGCACGVNTAGEIYIDPICREHNKRPAEILARRGKATPKEGIVDVPLDKLAGVAGDDNKMRDHIRNAIRLVKDKGALAAMYDQYVDLWTDDMTQLGKDRLRVLAGLQPEGPPF